MITLSRCKKNNMQEKDSQLLPCFRFFFKKIQFIVFLVFLHQTQILNVLIIGGKCYFFLFFQFFELINLFLTALNLCCCSKPFSDCREQGLLSSRSARVSHCGDFSCCGAQAPEHELSSCCALGLVAPRHVESSQTNQGLNYVPCIGRWTLNHWTESSSIF